MVTKFRGLLAGSLVLLLISGCASGGTDSITKYAGLGGSPVSVRCGGAYLVSNAPEGTTADPFWSKPVISKPDEPTRASLLVTPYAASSLYQAVCEGIRPDQRSGNATGVPFEEGAREYLISVLKRDDCQIISGEKVGPLHSEFTYVCPVRKPVSPRRMSS